MSNISVNPKFKITNLKQRTLRLNNKFKITNIKQFRSLVFRICFGFWILNFGFIYFGFAPPVRAATSTTTGTVPLTIPTTSDTTAPTPVVLHLPPDDTTLSTSSPEFAWYQSTDPNGNHVVYNLYFFNTATYLNISNLGNSSASNYTTRLDGNLIYLSPIYALPDGRYTWYVTASDLSGNTSRSETWSFTITTTYPFLTATIAKLETGLPLAYLAVGLLALAISLLLIFLWRRRYNLILIINPAGAAGQRLDSRATHSTIYHSNPLTHTLYSIQNTSYSKLYLPHLGRYSTLTIKLDSQIYVMSISAKRRLYTIILG